MKLKWERESKKTFFGYTYTQWNCNHDGFKLIIRDGFLTVYKPSIIHLGYFYKSDLSAKKGAVKIIEKLK